MEERDNRKGNTVLLTVIAVATLLVAVIGATFAYFSVSVTGNDGSGTSVIVKTASLGIEYSSGQEIDGQNIRPGWSATKTFTVKNSGEVEMTFRITWDNVTNTFDSEELGKPEELVYTITGSSDGAGTPKSLTATQAPAADGDAITDIVIAPGRTYSYDLTISFPDTSDNQDYNQGKQFRGRIQIVAENVSTPTP